MDLAEILTPLDQAVAAASPEQLAHRMNAAKAPLFDLALGHLGHPAAAKALTVKILNLLMAKRDLWYRAMLPRSRPFGLIIDPSNGCALHCPGCVHSERSITGRLFDWPAAMAAPESAARLFRLYGTSALQVIFCNYGEPLLNPETPRYIEMARSYLAQTMLSSSLSVRKFDPDAYVRSGLDYMVLSIDGASQEVYGRYRRNGSLSLALDNLAALTAAKRRLGSRTPVLCWQFLTFEHNAHELAAAIELARQAGADEFNAVTPFDVTWDDPSIRAAAMEPVRIEFHGSPEPAMADHLRHLPAWFDEAAIDAAYGQEWGTAFEAGEGPTCRWLYKNIAMDGAGRILPCCGAPAKDNPDLVLARIGQDAEPYHSQGYRRARLSFVNPGATGETACSRCAWQDTEADVDYGQVTAYLRAIGPPLLQTETIRLLAEW